MRKKRNGYNIIHISPDVYESNKHRFPDLKRYEVEVRLILESMKGSTVGEKYKAYMNTTHWAILRHSKKKLVGYKCELCGFDRSRKLLHTHHINYRNLYDVELSDLQVLCHNCHNKHHNFHETQDDAANKAESSQRSQK